MSQYTTYRVDTTPEINTSAIAAAAGIAGTLIIGTAKLAVRSLRSLYEHVKGRISELEALGTPLAMARLQALEEAPLLEAAVLTEIASSLGIPDISRDILQDRLKKADTTVFDRLVRQGQNRLSQGQVQVLSNSIIDVISELGYTVHTPKRPPRDDISLTAVRSTDGTSVTAHLVPQTDTLEVKLRGFSGGTCLLLLHEIEQRLRRRGVELRVVREQRHDDRTSKCHVGEVNETRSIETAPHNAAKKKTARRASIPVARLPMRR